MSYKIYLVLIFFGVLGLSKFTFVNKNSFTAPKYFPDAQFYQYWHSGLAEINEFELFQSRYGEIKKGTATLIFVTEDFIPKKQIKASKNDETQSIFKLNMIKKFVAGAYDYYMMLSVFSPISESGFYPYKIASSVSEWCGQSFAQFLRINNDYDFTENTYLGENAFYRDKLPLALSEDAIWNIIRINPYQLPIGEIKIIPNLFQCRLLTKHPEIKNAKASLNHSIKAPDWLVEKDNISSYEIVYSQENIKFIFYFKNSFPYRIEGWLEQYEEFVKGEKIQAISYAVRKETNLCDYWNKTKLVDSLGCKSRIPF